jgi:four helix bundle protein
MAASREKYNAVIDSCYGGIAGMVTRPIYTASVELYFLFLNTENSYADWKNQACRAASSVGANLCEGYGRGSPGQRAQFYGIARGSIYECVHWANLAEGESRTPLLNKSLEVAAMIDSELEKTCREAQDIL